MTRTELAQALGKAGGNARAAALTAKQRSAIARKAARARWRKPRKTSGPARN
jgi:hypothetical protein